MEHLFLKLWNMSMAAGWLILAVILLRFLLKKAKAPKWINCLMWGMVALRLLCPISFESVLSLVPSGEMISKEVLISQNPQINTGVSSVNQMINPILSETMRPDPTASVNPLQLWTFVAVCIWMIGVAVLLLYAVISYWKLYRKVKLSIRIQNQVWICDEIQTPFILGIVQPKIYLPSDLDESLRKSVLQHEENHIRRKDHWWKPLGFLILCIYWFHPLVWAGYILLCRDIEMACDESVVKKMDDAERRNYSEALLGCSVSRHQIAACPLAFGEVGVKERIRLVLNYKKPGFWVILVAVISCIIVAVCFLTNPKETENKLDKTHSEESDEDAMVPYVKNEDGTWTAEEKTYQYRKELQGRSPNAACESVYIVLTNREDLTFEEVDYSMISSQLITDQDFRIVDMYVIEPSAEELKTFRTLDQVKDLLNDYGDTPEELQYQECYVVIHGNPFSGEAYWSTFYENVANSVPSEVILIQFTTEGDPFLTYIQYNGASLYCVIDSSRDHFGSGEYVEQMYQYIKAFDQIEENGDIYRQIYLLNQDWSMEEIKDLYYSEQGVETADMYQVLTAVVGNTKANELCEVLDAESEETAYQEESIPKEKITRIDVKNGNTGKAISLKPEDQGFDLVADAYLNLEYMPFVAEDAKMERMGYLYRLQIYAQDGKLSQTLIPYTDAIRVDGEMYDCSMNRSGADLLIQLEDIF